MYLVIEIQTNKDGTVGNFVWAYVDLLQAEAKYHAVLSAAAVSSLPMHSVVILDNAGSRIKGECYTHV